MYLSPAFFQVEPVLLKLRMVEVVVTTGATRCAKLQSNVTTNTQCLTGRMPFLSPNQRCQSSEGNLWKCISDVIIFYWLLDNTVWRGCESDRVNWSSSTTSRATMPSCCRTVWNRAVTVNSWMRSNSLRQPSVWVLLWTNTCCCC